MPIKINGKLGKFDRIMKTLESAIRSKVRQALIEDAKFDITSDALDLKGIAVAQIISEENGIVCGILEAKEAFDGLKIKVLKNDGQKIKKGDAILTIEGNIKQILRRERIALNYLQLLSGIATVSGDILSSKIASVLV
ncbi:MAG: hypothetical protein AABY04_02615, partial [Candidatus Micrarchaeota archaeon]